MNNDPSASQAKRLAMFRLTLTGCLQAGAVVLVIGTIAAAFVCAYRSEMGPTVKLTLDPILLEL